MEVSRAEVLNDLEYSECGHITLVNYHQTRGGEANPPLTRSYQTTTSGATVDHPRRTAVCAGGHPALQPRHAHGRRVLDHGLDGVGWNV